MSNKQHYIIPRWSRRGKICKLDISYHPGVGYHVYNYRQRKTGQAHVIFVLQVALQCELNNIPYSLSNTDQLELLHNSISFYILAWHHRKYLNYIATPVKIKWSRLVRQLEQKFKSMQCSTFSICILPSRTTLHRNTFSTEFNRQTEICIWLTLNMNCHHTQTDPKYSDFRLSQSHYTWQKSRKPYWNPSANIAS